MKQRLIILIVIIQSSFVWAQTRSVTGTVIDKDGIGIPGVNIIETGTTNGVTSDFDGDFSISVNDNSTLTISYVGFVTQVVPIKGKTTINVTLEEDVARLDEVVIIGYGTVKKKDLTSPARLPSSAA